MTKTFAAFLILSFAASPAMPARAPAQLPVGVLTGSTAAQIVSGTAIVIDGDTIEIDTRRIRLWGIDAPEIRHKKPRQP